MPTFKFNSILLSIFLTCIFFILSLVVTLFLDGKRLPRILPQQVIQEAQALNSKQQYDKSVQTLMLALKDEPKNLELRQFLHDTLFMQTYKKITEGNLKIKTNPHNVEAYYEIAEAYSFVDDNKKAMEILLKGVIENPKASLLWMTIGKLELAAKRYKEALSVFREMYHLDNKNSEAHYLISYLLLSNEKIAQKALEEALFHAKEALKIQPSNTEYIQVLAEASFRKGDNIAATQLIKEAMRLDPGDEQAVYEPLLSRYTAP